MQRELREKFEIFKILWISEATAKNLGLDFFYSTD